PRGNGAARLAPTRRRTRQHAGDSAPRGAAARRLSGSGTIERVKPRRIRIMADNTARTGTKKTIRPAPVRRSIEVKAPQLKAFEVFTRKTSVWWPKKHHIGKAELAEAIIEPKVNGRWYERGVDGSECEWGRVLAWNPPNGITLA